MKLTLFKALSKTVVHSIVITSFSFIILFVTIAAGSLPNPLDDNELLIDIVDNTQTEKNKLNTIEEHTLDIYFKEEFSNKVLYHANIMLPFEIYTHIWGTPSIVVFAPPPERV